jgi:hypothetical protein
MAATAWKLYAKAKEYLGDGTIQLGTNAFKMALFASGNASTIGLSTYASVSAEIGTSGGYASGGKFLVPSAGTWTLSGSTVTFSYSTIGLTFTASGGPLTDVKYAVIYQSGGKLLCWSRLSSVAFTVVSPNTLTVLPSGTGVFTLT